MSIGDKLCREAIKELLREINKKMFTQKKEAITKFIVYITETQPKLSTSSMEYLLVGDKSPGIIQGIGQRTWKGSFHKFTNVLLDLLQILLSSEYEHSNVAKKVFLSLGPATISEMQLSDHQKKKSGNNDVASWMIQYLESNSKTLADAAKGGMMQREKKDRKSRSAKSIDITRLNTRQQASKSVSVADMRAHDSTTRFHSEQCIMTDSKKKKGFMNYLSGFFNRRPNKGALEKKGILQAAKVFGAPFEQLCREGKNGLPAVVRDCVNHLQAHLTHVGLFRIPGNATNILALKQKYDYGGEIDLSEETANDVSGLLKLYLRDMQEPLLTWDNYESIVEAYDSIRSDGGSALQSVIDTLPACRTRLLYYICGFFRSLSEHSEVNMMKPRNIAICLAPNILRPKVETLQSVAKDAPAVTGTIKWLIEKATPAKEEQGEAKLSLRDSNLSKTTPKLQTSMGSVSTPNSQKLPPGWREVTRDGKTYFYNETENYSQWDRPLDQSQVTSRPESMASIGSPENGEDALKASGIPSRIEVISEGTGGNTGGERESKKKKMPPPFAKQGSFRKPPPFQKQGSFRKKPPPFTKQASFRKKPQPLLKKNEDALPAGWTKHVEQSSRKVYYFHAVTKKSQWTKPE